MNSNEIYECKIWPGYPGSGRLLWDRDVIRVGKSPRAGGKYEITHEALANISECTDVQKARLTTMLIDQRQDMEWPVVTTELVKDAEKRTSLSAKEREDSLLRYMTNATAVSEMIYINDPTQADGRKLDKNHITGCYAMAWSESSTFDEVQYSLADLVKRGLVGKSGPIHYQVTVDGREFINDQERDQGAKADSSQVFVAMWMDPCMDEVYQDGISPAIEKAGYSPFRVDIKYHLNKIEDEAIAAIRRSRFLVVDFTHDGKGARGSVYFEAGFADALGKPIIYTCRHDQGKDVHFDVAHQLRIEWATIEDLQTKLLKAIKDVID